MATTNSKKEAPKAKVETKKPIEEKPVAKPVEKKVEPFSKLPNLDNVLKTYELLMKQFAEMESSQRRKGKPYRLFFVHRRRIEALKLNLEKTIRRS